MLFLLLLLPCFRERKNSLSRGWKTIKMFFLSSLHDNGATKWCLRPEVLEIFLGEEGVQCAAELA